MSTHMHWVPATPQPLGGSISVAMRHALAWYASNGDDTSLDGCRLGMNDRAYLAGVLAGAPEGSDLRNDAQTLIDGINKYTEIKIVRA